MLSAYPWPCNDDVFGKGRDFAAWLGLVPKQTSTGGTPDVGPHFQTFAQMKADSSQATAVAATFGSLPLRRSGRKRPHNRAALSMRSRVRASVQPPPLAATPSLRAPDADRPR